MKIEQLFDSATSTYTYLLTSKDEALLIDPVREALEHYIARIDHEGLALRFVIDTHVHADHVTAAGALGQMTGALTCVSSLAEVSCADKALAHGDVIRFGDSALEVRHTPGHTRGCMTLVCHREKTAFTGDALLIRGAGRTDFQEGSARALFRSVRQQIFSLDDEYTLYPAHDYQGRLSTSVGDEKKNNPRLGLAFTEDAFVAIMDNLNLAYPRHIDEALPLNMRCGLAIPSSAERRLQDEGVREISADKLRQRIDNLRVVDVREKNEHEGPLAPIAKSELIALARLRKTLKGNDKTTPIVVVCRSGKRSARAALLLKGLGFSNVLSLAGGLLAWHALHQKEVRCTLGGA